MPSSDQIAPAELARRIEQGDREAEALLVERFLRGVDYMLRRLTGDPTLAEDLLQETFRVALEKLRAGELRQPDRLAGFLRGTARNLAIGEFRRRARRAEVGGDEPLEQRPDPAAGQLSRVQQAEDRRLVHRLLGELRSDRDRQVLFRFYVAEEKRQTICADLGLTRRQFNLVLFRARRRFRELVERSLGAAPEGGEVKA